MRTGPFHRLPILLTLSLALAGCSSLPQATKPAFENALGMKFVLVPAGEFLMGSDETPEALAKDFPSLERKRFTDLFDEAPVHRVRITRPFLLGQHEVTVGQFRRFLEASGYQPESIADGTGGFGYRADYDPAKSDNGDAFEGRNRRYSWANPGFAQDDSHPVLNVTFKDALAMSQWLSQKEGAKYRLPTEAEWEYACRAGTQTRYPNGNDPQRLPEIANVFDARTAEGWPQWRAQAIHRPDGHVFTAPVGSYQPNAFGLFDMVGNAWEWVSDRHEDNYYAQSPLNDPQGPDTSGVRVRRGGSWHTWPLYARCSYRNWNSEATRYTLLGIRLLREVDPSGR